MRPSLLAATLLLGLAPPATADPLERGQVAADAKWLAHIDFDALRAATVVQRTHAKWFKPEVARQGLERLGEQLGVEKQVLHTILETIEMDLMHDFGSMTFYGGRFVRHSGVVLIRATVDRDRLMEHLGKGPEYRVSSHGDHELHSWTLQDTSKREYTVTGCIYSSNLVVVGRDVAEIRAALDVLDGRAPSLAGSGSPLDADAPAGTVLLARVAGLAGVPTPLKSPVVRQSELVGLALGQHDKTVFAEGMFVAKSPDVAQQVRAVVEGLVAAAKLQHDGDPDAQQVLKAVKVTADGPMLTVAWQQPADEVLKLIGKLWIKQAQAKLQQGP